MVTSAVGVRANAQVMQGGPTFDPAALLSRTALLRTSVPSLIFGLFLFLRLFYLLDGGNAQPADYLLMAMTPFFFKLNALREVGRVNPWLIALIVLMISVNSGWFFMTGKTSIGVSALYYIYNITALVIAFTIRSSNADVFDRVMLYVILLSAAIEVTALQVGPTSLYRSTGTFTNPNQLAYWALCAATLVTLVGGKHRLLQLAGLLLLSLAALMSVSRGGIFGMAILLILLFPTWVRNLHLRVLTLVAILFGIAFVFSAFGDDIRNEFGIAQRLEARSEQRSSSEELDNRNFNRLTEEPGYIAVGAGEGGFDRFVTERYKYKGYARVEIHNTYLTLLFCYGATGLFLFFGMLAAILKELPRQTFYLSGILVYGMSHNGLRYTLFWIVLAVLLSMIWLNKQQRAAVEQRRAHEAIASG